MTTDASRHHASQIANLFGGNGLSMNQSIELVAAYLDAQYTSRMVRYKCCVCNVMVDVGPHALCTAIEEGQPNRLGHVLVCVRQIRDTSGQDDTLCQG